ncbi:MAG TPA: efflux RND transporter periplasmic adaptor subunit [Polyangiaceae bacterium]|nr:efflux RND transporter periplasmic adaptor subunit [Polyangiaceae bacterium]
MFVHLPQSMTLLSALTALLLAGCRDAEATAPPAAPPPEVSVATVISEPLHDWEEFTGRLEERHRVEVRPRVAGYIDTVHFEDGARVKRGQLLFEIDPRPFQAEVERWSGEVERASSQHALARLNHERGQRLLASQVIATEAADQLAADEASARGALKSSSASLRQARLEREFTEVRAPIDGRVSRALIRPGNLVSSQSVLTTLVSEGPLLAYFDADERTFLRLQDAQRAAQTADAPRVLLALANETGHPHEGRLDFIDNGVDPQTGLITLRALFDNADGKLTPGLFARLELVLPETLEAVLIEDRAVGTDLGKKFVLVLGPEDTLEYREVSLGAAIGGLRRVEQGLKPGDSIVVNGLFRARPGMKVTPKRVAMDAARAELKQLGARDGTALALSEPAPKAKPAR